MCAVLLWFAVAREPMVETAYSVAIEFHQMPPHLEITTTGFRWRKSGCAGRTPHPPAQSSDVHPVINLGGSSIGEHTYDFTASQVHVPYGIEVVQVTPSEIRIGFDRSLIAADRDSSPRQRPFRARRPACCASAPIPATITVVGPEIHVRAAEASPSPIPSMSAACTARPALSPMLTSPTRWYAAQAGADPRDVVIGSAAGRARQ